jgi:anti-anti-sigma regulatory factor
MANNFRVNVIGGDLKRLNLKILGDFDGTSAFRLLNVIEQKGGSASRITIDTDGLRSVNTFGSDIFRANIAEMNKGARTIDYTGRFKEALTED